jgi:hypothetical protein
MIGGEEQPSGFVDRCFTLEAPASEGSEAKMIKCCWFDDKNLAVLDKHQDEVNEHIEGGKELKWDAQVKPSMRLLLKVNTN